MDQKDLKGQQMLFGSKWTEEDGASWDTIGAEPGNMCMDDKAIRDYVAIAGVKYVKERVMAGEWRITEKGRKYLQEHV